MASWDHHKTMGGKRRGITAWKLSDDVFLELDWITIPKCYVTVGLLHFRVKHLRVISTALFWCCVTRRPGFG